MIDQIPSRRNPELTGHIKIKLDKVVVYWKNSTSGATKRDARDKHQNSKILKVPLNSISKKNSTHLRLYDKGNYGQFYVSKDRWIEIEDDSMSLILVKLVNDTKWAELVAEIRKDRIAVI